MMYGVKTGNSIITYTHEVPNSKPMIESEPEQRENYRSTYEWVDDGGRFIQVFSYVPLTQEEIDENERHKRDEEPSADELIDIIIGGTP